MAHDSVNVRTLAFGVGLALLGVFSLFIYKFSKKQEKEEKSGEEKGMNYFTSEVCRHSNL